MRAKRGRNYESKCEVCDKNTSSFVSRPKKFCSRDCYHISTKGKISPRKGIKTGKSSWNKGKMGIYSEATKNKMREAKLGTKQSETTRRKMSDSHKGENSSNWQGGKTKQSLLIRHSLEYKLWRESVFRRDNWTCIWCGDKTGGNLNADHIKPFAFYPELRFAIDNGRTLCVPCHKTTDTYLNPKNLLKQK